MATIHVTAGSLRHAIRIEELVTEVDSSGEAVQDAVTGEVSRSWQSIASPWAAILPSSGREFIAAQATQSKVTGKMIIRYRDGVTAGMRVVHNTKIFNIEAILSDTDSGIEYLTLLTSVGVSDSGL